VRIVNNIIFPILVLFIGKNVFAADFRYGLGTAIGLYDNVTLVSEPESSETSIDLLGNLVLFQNDANMFADINGSVRVINYVNDIANDQVIGNLSANVIWKLQPQRFEWYFTDSLRQSVIDTQVSDAPSNRQYVNVFSTGPNYIIRLNPRNNIQLEARAESYNYEQNIDNKRGFLAARWLHDINSSLIVSINSESVLARFTDDVINSDFERSDLFINFAYASGVNTFDAEFGYTTINNENINDIEDSRYLLSFTNARTTNSSVRVVLEHILSDTGRQVLDSNLTGNSIVGSAANDIFIDDLIQLQYFKTISTGNITFDLGASERDYKRQNNLDERVYRFDINGNWNLSGANNLTYSLNFRNRDFLNSVDDRIDDDSVYTVTYSHNLKRNLSFSTQIASLKRSSTSLNRSYDDIRILFSIDYTSF